MNPNLDDISFALTDGLLASESLMSWHRPNSRGYELAESMRDTCQRGIKAFDLLRAQLREGKAHVEPPEGRGPPTCCTCAHGFPPCSFCVDWAKPTEIELDTTNHRRQIGDPRL